MNDRYKFRVLENCKRCGFKYSYYDMTNKGGVQNGWDECEKHCLSERYPTETIEQCTGLKDKNDVLAFEGDTWSGVGYDRKGVIEFDEDSYSFQFGLDGSVMDQERSVMESGQFIITGNIHDA